MSSLLFDLYGVLLRTQSEEAKRRIEWAVVGDESIWSTYWDLRPAYDAGLVSDTNYWQQLRLRIGLPDFDIFEAVAADEASWLEADEEMVDYVLSLIGSGWRVGILSNIPEGLAKKVRRKFPWLAEFAAVTFSADIGVAKPDEKAYHVAIDAMGAKLGETIFIDDQAINVEAAEQLGMRGQLFTGIESVRALVTEVRGQ